MRKYYVLVLLLVCAAGLIAKPIGQIGLGVDFPGKHTLEIPDDTEEFTTNLGISPSLELLFHLSPRFLAGPGLEFQIPRGFDENELEAAYSFIPIFLSLKVAPVHNASLRAEILGHVGYNILCGNKYYFPEEELHGGLYLAGGVGIVSPDGVTFDLMYRMHSGSIGEDDYFYSTKIDVTQTNVTARIGRRF